MSKHTEFKMPDAPPARRVRGPLTPVTGNTPQQQPVFHKPESTARLGRASTAAGQHVLSRLRRLEVQEADTGAATAVNWPLLTQLMARATTRAEWEAIVAQAHAANAAPYWVARSSWEEARGCFEAAFDCYRQAALHRARPFVDLELGLSQLAVRLQEYRAAEREQIQTLAKSMTPAVRTTTPPPSAAPSTAAPSDTSTKRYTLHYVPRAAKEFLSKHVKALEPVISAHIKQMAPAAYETPARALVARAPATGITRSRTPLPPRTHSVFRASGRVTAPLSTCSSSGGGSSSGGRTNANPPTPEELPVPSPPLVTPQLPSPPASLLANVPTRLTTPSLFSPRRLLQTATIGGAVAVPHENVESPGASPGASPDAGGGFDDSPPPATTTAAGPFLTPAMSADDIKRLNAMTGTGSVLRFVERRGGAATGGGSLCVTPVRRSSRLQHTRSSIAERAAVQRAPSLYIERNRHIGDDLVRSVLLLLDSIRAEMAREQQQQQ